MAGLPDIDTRYVIGAVPGELVVHDGLVPCPYLDDLMARMPLRVPNRPLDDDEMDLRLSEGQRRHGVALYTPRCPTCAACEAIRVDVAKFKLSRNHKRVMRKASQQLSVVVAPPKVTARRIELYEAHLHGRGLAPGDRRPISWSRYVEFLVRSCCTTVEVRYLREGELVGVAVTDVTTNALSAHYTYYHPDYSALSVGTFSILEQIALTRRLGRQYLYLGLYVAPCRAMSYKARFLPHERLVDGRWVAYDKG